MEPSDFAVARRNTEKTVYCLMNGLRRANPETAKRLGLLGLLSMIRDPKIQRGLGLLLELARGLGECAGKR